MNDEMRTEAMELCVTACEKFSTNNEVNKFCLLQMLINLIMIVAAWIPWIGSGGSIQLASWYP